MDTSLFALPLTLALGFCFGVLYEHWRIGRKLDAIERRVKQIETAIRSEVRSDSTQGRA